MTEERKEPVAHDLSADQDLVLSVLQDSEGPLDAIALSSRTRLSVERVLEALTGLEERGLVKRQEPEPVHERFASADLQLA